MTKSIWALASFILLNGCTTNIQPVATGGSKADGTIVLSYEYGAFQKPVVDWTGADTQASERCRAWGYKSAEAFGGLQNYCLAHNSYGTCVRFRVNIPYQCI